MISLFDTASASVRPLELREPGRLGMYVCGPTVYGDPHIGHGRFSLAWDVLRRYLTWSGLEVRYVSNVTDIDDKIIARSADEGVPVAEIARRYEDAWWAAMDGLGVLRPTADPHATSYVEQMVDLIGDLVERGVAYVGGDGVYFEAEKVENYGLLGRQPLASLRAGARLELDDERGKRSPVDFSLWKWAKPGEPCWDSPWGAGRPGWHTECVVMALDLLGESFDLHGGGIDLAFPHHENERAQAVACGRPFARHWVHSGHVTVDGEKMSKSLGNVMSLPQLLAEHDGRAYRLLVLQSHYRSPMTVSSAGLAGAEEAVARLDGFARRFAGVTAGVTADPVTLDAFRERMDDDLDTPGATAGLFRAVTAANALGPGPGSAPVAAAVLDMAGALGLMLRSAGAEVDEASARLVAERDAARAGRDFARADALRAELQALGWVVEDTPAGTSIHR